MEFFVKRIMTNYRGMFNKLKACSTDCSPELQAFIRQVADAPIWDDDQATMLLADAATRIVDRDGDIMTHNLDAAHTALAELRGEDQG